MEMQERGGGKYRNTVNNIKRGERGGRDEGEYEWRL